MDIGDLLISVSANAGLRSRTIGCGYESHDKKDDIIRDVRIFFNELKKIDDKTISRIEQPFVDVGPDEEGEDTQLIIRLRRPEEGYINFIFTGNGEITVTVPAMDFSKRYLKKDFSKFIADSFAEDKNWIFTQEAQEKNSLFFRLSMRQRPG